MSMKRKEMYESPKVKVVKVEVEKGFAISNPFLDNPKQEIGDNIFYYTLDKVKNGGQAW